MPLRRYSALLIIVAIVAAAIFVYSVRAELLAAVGSASLVFLGLAYAATLAQNVTLWLVFHASAGAGRAYPQTARMYFGSQVAKYLPGKVWGLVYQATLKAQSMPMGNLVHGNIVIYMLSVVSVVFASLALIVYSVSLSLAAVLLVAGGALSIWFMSSDHLYKIIQRISRLSRRVELTAEVPATDFPMLTRSIVYLLLLVAYVLSNVFLLNAFFELELQDTLRLTAYLGIAWLAGVIVAISPSGLGIREAVFVGIGYISDSNYELYASIAIVARGLQVLQDLVSVVLVPAVVGLVCKEDEAGAQEAESRQ